MAIRRWGPISLLIYTLARALVRDPQMESVLRSRRAELGLQHTPNRSLDGDLMQRVGVERQRGRELGLGLEL